MELTKQQASDLIRFLEDNQADKTLADLPVILKFIDNNTMSGVSFDLSGEQTDDMREVFAYMMRNKLTKLDTLKKQ